MKRDMQTLQRVLWEEFEAAVARQPQYLASYNADYASQSSPQSFVIENRKVIAELGQAIALANSEQRAERAEQLLAEQQKTDADLCKGTVRPLSALPRPSN